MKPVAKRTITALTTATLAVLGILYVPTAVVLPVLVALVALVHLEFSQMVAKRHEIMVWPGVAMGLVVSLIAAYFSVPVEGKRVLILNVLLAAQGVLLAVCFLSALFGRWKSPLTALGMTLLGVGYIPSMLTSFIRLPLQHGVTMFLYVIAIVKISDMGGFALGVGLGKHKMCPSISPNKSWEGMLGSVLASCIMSCLFLPVTHFGVGKALAFGVVAAVAGTLGDLVESRFKRECGVKDSATFMPAGLGGFLDMFDSLIFVPAILSPFI